MEQVSMYPELTEDLLLRIIPGLISPQISKIIAEKNKQKFIQECVSTYPFTHEIINYCYSTRISNSPCCVGLFQDIYSNRSLYTDNYHGQKTKIDRWFHAFIFIQGVLPKSFFHQTASFGYGYSMKQDVPYCITQGTFFNACINMKNVDKNIVKLLEQMNFVKFHEGNESTIPGDVFEFSTRLDLLSVYNIMCNRLTSLSNTERLFAITLIKQFLLRQVDLILTNNMYELQTQTELIYNLETLGCSVPSSGFRYLCDSKLEKSIDKLKNAIMDL